LPQDGEWIITKRKKTVYYDENGKEIDFFDINYGFNQLRKEELEFEISEGDTNNYWIATAANAIKPLHQLLALAKMRPDCIWDGD
jgi:hypothetical protein